MKTPTLPRQSVGHPEKLDQSLRIDLSAVVSSQRVFVSDEESGRVGHPPFIT
jgi:hypothetical protein